MQIQIGMCGGRINANSSGTIENGVSRMMCQRCKPTKIAESAMLRIIAISMGLTVSFTSILTTHKSPIVSWILQLFIRF